MLVICGLSEDSHPEDVEVISRGLGLHFLVSDAEHFPCACWPSVVTFGKYHSGLLSISKSGFFFFDF